MKSPLTDQPIHILECRTEICAALPDDGKIPHVGFHLFLIRNETVLLHLFIALDDVDVGLLKITVRLTKHVVGFLQKTPHQIPGTGHGGVDHHNKILDPADFFGFQRLDERHIAIQRKPIGIKDRIKGIWVDLHLLPQHRKALQKVTVIIPFPVLHLDLLQYAFIFLILLVSHGFHLGLHLFPVIAPLRLAHHGSLRGILREIPETVVIHQKLRRQTLQPPRLQLLFLQHAIHALCIQHSKLRMQPSVPVPAKRRRCHTNAFYIHVVQHGFHRNIAGQVPKFRFPFAARVHMAEQAVQHHVQICPVHMHAPPLVQIADVIWMIVDHKSICPHTTAARVCLKSKRT